MTDSAQDRLARLETRFAAVESRIELLFGALRDSAKVGQLVTETGRQSFLRLLRLERAFVALATFTHPGAGGPSLQLQQVVLSLLDEIRRDLADYDKTRGGHGG